MAVTAIRLPDGWGHAVTSVPAVEPLTAADFRGHARVTATTEDTYITSLLKAARLHVENYLRRKLITQTITITMDAFPGGNFSLPFPPAIALTTVKYRDTASTQQTLAPTPTMRLGNPNLCAVILEPDAGWPSTDDESQAIEIAVQVGYGATGASVPESILLAIKQLTSHWYENREPVVEGAALHEMPLHVKALLAEHQWYY